MGWRQLQDAWALLSQLPVRSFNRCLLHGSRVVLCCEKMHGRLTVSASILTRPVPCAQVGDEQRGYLLELLLTKLRYATAAMDSQVRRAPACHTCPRRACPVLFISWQPGCSAPAENRACPQKAGLGSTSKSAK